jgi:hypothetical protein
MRKFLTAFAVFAVAGGLLAVAEAKKPLKVAVLHQPKEAAPEAAQKEDPPPPRKKKHKPQPDDFMTVHEFGGY